MSAYAIRNMKTGEYAIFDMTANVTGWTWELETTHNPAYGRVVAFVHKEAADHICNFVRNDFRASNKAAGEPLEVVRI